MTELCLVASHGYPPELFVHPAEQGSLGRVFKGHQPFLTNPGSSQGSLQLRYYKPRQSKPSIGILDGNEFFKADSIPRRPLLIDVQGSLFFGLGIANQCIMRERVLRFLMSGLSLITNTTRLKSSASSSRKVSSSSPSSASSVSETVVEEEALESPTLDSTEDSQENPSSKVVLVVGGSGGVGQLVVASLLSRNIKARLILRDPEKATSLFGKQDKEQLQVVRGDTRNPQDLDPSIFEGITHVICCTGTTAFPSKRWDGDNTPERVDWEGVRNLVSALPPSVKRIVLVSSIGVTKFNELPWSIMNLFGVLKYKKMGEDFVRNSGLPFTIIRAGRLTDGPYTSYDLNTLLQATAGERRAVLLGQGDKLVGEVSRLVVAEACIQALDIDLTECQIYEINSIKGEGPGNDREKWQELFKSAHTQFANTELILFE